MGTYFFKLQFHYLISTCITLMNPYLDLNKDHDEDMLEIVEASQMNEEVAKGGKCWKNIWLGILSVTGDQFNCLTKTSSWCFTYHILFLLKVEGFIDNSPYLG